MKKLFKFSLAFFLAVSNSAYADTRRFTVTLLDGAPMAWDGVEQFDVTTKGGNRLHILPSPVGDKSVLNVQVDLLMSSVTVTSPGVGILQVPQISTHMLKCAIRVGESCVGKRDAEDTATIFSIRAN